MKPHLLLALFFVPLAALCGNAAAAPGEVVVVPLQGAVSKAQVAFLKRSLKQAEADKAQAFIMEMDTPGGELGAAVEILQLLLKANVPTYTWVNTNAGSAGALIALASDHVYMAPVSAIGAAAPVSGQGAEIPETMNDKIVSYYSGYFRSAAAAKGRNPALAEAFINKDTEFKIDDQVISAKGSLLTLSAQEAVRRYDGKPLLADGLADSIDQLKREAKLTGPTVRVEPSGFERIAQWITLLAPLFLLGGIAAAYMEFKTPGFGVAGAVSFFCFGIFFFGHYIAGLTGLEVIAFFALGVILILVELILFPGVFVLAAAGVLLMLGSLLFAMVDYFPGEPLLPTLDMLARPAMNLAIALALSVVVIALLARFFPSLPVFRRLILATNQPTGPAFAPEIPAPAAGLAVGMTGVARSILRPAGKAEIDGALHDVVTDGEFVNAGEPVRVIELTGTRIVVAPAPSVP